MLFGGNIENVALYLCGELTLTGDNNAFLPGDVTDETGAYIKEGWLQVGDGVTNGQIQGVIEDTTTNGLIFDVVGSGSETFTGAFYEGDEGGVGSVLKTGGGKLVFDDYAGNYAYEGSGTIASYIRAMTVDGGTLQLGNNPNPSYPSGNALAADTELIVDNGDFVDLDGQSTPDLQSVTLNDGTIENTDASQSATLTASNSFNFAQGTIGAGVTLAGTASLNNARPGP